MLVALVGDLHALELLAVELVRRLQRLRVLHGRRPVPVADDELKREVVPERGRRGGRQREPAQRGVLDGDGGLEGEAVGGDHDGDDDDSDDGGEAR